MKPFVGSPRYELLNHLGSGTFGEVYEVHDRERKARIALKRPHESSAEDLYYFKQEFRALADITHPNLIELHELVAETDDWFFTMELVQGLSFTRALRHAPLAGNAGSLRSLLRQLTEGLLTVHGAGKLHRDIKPSNVLVTPEGRLVLLDFGLTVDVGLEKAQDTLTTRHVGTPIYMAPEQLDGYLGTRASDWYSVGVMLYEVLAGQPPYRRESVRELTRAKLQQDPPPLSSMTGHLPEDLAELCMGLLRREPSERLGGDDILARLNHSGSLRPEAPPPRPDPALFVGRKSELVTLLDAFRQAKAGRPTLLRLHGGSGTGKTRLLSQFMGQVRRDEPEAVILHGRCYVQESVPFKALDPLMDELSGRLMQMSIEEAGTLVPRNARALSRLFPTLDRVDPFRFALQRSEDNEDVKSTLRRASQALRELLGRLRERRPVLLVVDDLQWGDPDSIHLIQDLLAPPDPPGLLVVACYRTDEVATSPALRELLSVPTGAFEAELPLRALDPSDAEHLALSLIGRERPHARSLAERIAKDSAGNPFYIGELAHHAGTRDGAPGTALEVDLFSCIRERLSALPAKTRRIVDVLAAAGHPLPWATVKTVSQAGDEGFPAPSLFKAGRLLRVRNTPGQALEIYHDFVRRAALSAMSDRDRQRLHARLAEAMEAAGGAAPETLAQQYLQADQTEKAAEWTAAAADQAAQGLAFKNAAELYRRSISLRAAADPLIPALLLHLAQALSNAGLGKEAAETYLDLASRISSEEAPGLQRRAAEEYFRCGQIDLGLATIRPQLTAIGMAFPATRFGARLSRILYGLLLQVRGHGFTPRTERDIPGRELEKLDICWTAIQGLGSGALMTGMDLQIRHLLLALRVGEPSRIIRALAHQAHLEAIHDGDQRNSRTRFYSSLSITLAEQHGDPYLLGHACTASGMAAFLQGRFGDAEQALLRAKAVYSECCIGVGAELHQVHSKLLHAQVLLGRVAEVNRALPKLIQDAQDRGDILAEANLMTSFSILTFLMRDDVEGARACLARARELCLSANFHSQQWQLIYLGGIVEQCAGKPSIYWNLLPQHHRYLAHSRILDVEYIRLAWWEHVARISIGYARSFPEGSSERHLALATARPAIKSLRRFKSDHYRGTYAKLRAMDAEARGDRSAALEWLQIAEEHYHNIPLPMHAHSAQWCRGTLMGPAGRALVKGAETWMRAQGIVHPGRYANFHIPCTDIEGAKE